MPSDDSLLFEILNPLVEKATLGEPVDFEAVAASHPELRDELYSLWATIVLAENLGTVIGNFEEQELLQDSSVPEEFGDYQLLEEVGRGGMGVVYRARQRSLNRTVAVKMLLNAELTRPGNLERFRGEAEWAAGLDHPNITSVYEVGEANGQPFFSMPYIDGTTLAKRIAERPLENREAARLLIPVCRAVASAHRGGVLHRDLKPSNILIDTFGNPFVSDFGLAKKVVPEGSDEEVVSITESGAILGTPGYMAPEQAVGARGEVTPATDVYALGAILYAALTGRAPFQAATPVDAILMILEQDPPLPRLLNPQIDSDLELIILKAIQKPADLRYDSADALADDLECYLNNEPVSARSSHFSQVLSRAFRPTHHVGVLENWGLLWMWHAVVLLTLCLITDISKHNGITSRPYFVAFWTLGLGAWAAIFWNLRRRAGPVTFVERQVAHIWAGSMAASSALFGLEYLMNMEPLKLSPVLALIAGMVFVAKAGILSGEFYVHAFILFLTAIPMALFPNFAVTIFGVVSAATFFVPGLKFYMQKRGNRRD